MIEFILMYNLIVQQGDEDVSVIAQYNNKDICENIAKAKVIQPIYTNRLRLTCVPTHIPIKK